MRKKRFVAALLVLLVGAILAQVWHGVTSLEEGPQEPSGSSQAVAPQNEEILSTHSANSPAARSQVADTRAYWATVVDTSEEVLEGVTATWAGLPGDLSGPDAVDWSSDLTKTTQNNLSAYSDDGGRVEFKEAPSGAESTSYVWLSKIGFEPRLIVMGENQGEWPQPQRWVMEPANPVQITVLDGQGIPVEGAWVSVCGVRPLHRGFFGLSLEEHGDEFLKIEGVTGSSGEFLVSAADRLVEIYATKERKVSPKWSGKLTADMTISLVPTFRVSGQVLVNGVGSEEPHGNVWVQAVRNGMISHEQSYPIGDGLKWGPLDLPLAGEDAYIFSAKGRGWHGKRMQLERPLAGTVHTISLEVKTGQDLWAMVFDEQDNPIVDAQFSLHWSDAIGSHSIDTYTYAGGIARLRGCPIGGVTVVATAPGYRGMTAKITLPQETPETLYFTLSPGTSLSGVCKYDGKTVSDFEILAWPVHDETQVLRWSFQGAKGGQFKVSGLPLGAVSVIARGPNHLSSPAVVVNTDSTGAEQVELVLGSSPRVRGRVLDPHGVVPPAAYAQALIGNQLVGNRWAVDGKGGFIGIVPGTLGWARIQVGGNEDAFVVVDKAVSMAGVTDFGTIVLAAVGAAHFYIEHESGLDPRACSLYCQDCPIVERSFDGEGKLIQPRMSEGVHFLQLELPDGSSGFLTTLVRHGAGEAIALELDGREQVVVRVVDVPENQGQNLYAELRPRPEVLRNKLSRQIAITEEGAAVFDWIRPDSYILRIQDSAGKILQTRFVQVRADERNHIEVSLDVDPVRLRLVDTAGEPHAGATVHIHHGKGMLVGTFTADAEGRVDVLPAEEAPVFLCVQTRTGEVAWNVPVPAGSPENGEPREVVLVCNASLRIELYDPSGPLANEPCKLVGDQIELDVSPTHSTDSQGRTSFDKLTPGQYLVQVSLPGHWPFNKLFEATPNAPITRIKIPRIADLKVRVQGAGGGPLANQPITVWSLDYDKDVKRWWEVGALDPSPADWKTDAQGEFVIPVMPEGPFRITCPGGETTITIEPDGENLANITVGP